MDEFEIKNDLIAKPTLVDLASVELAAESFVQVFANAEVVEDDINTYMKSEIHTKLIESLSGCALAVVQTEYLFPLHICDHMPRKPTVASSATVVIETSNDISVQLMPFKPDILDTHTEWTGVGFVAKVADVSDLTPNLKRIHQDFDLAPQVAIPLYQNLTSVTRLLNSAA